MKPLLIVKSLTPWHVQILDQYEIPYESVAPLSFTYPYHEQNTMQQLSAAKNLLLSSARSIEVLRLIPENDRLSKNIYVVGKSSAELVRELGFTNVFDAPDVETLSTAYSWDPADHYLYLRGNRSKATLTDTWKRSQISFGEVIVYHSNFTNPVIDASKYQALLFFSPSGVQSACAKNQIPRDTLIGSIGPSTTHALQILNFRNVVEGQECTFSSLIDTMIKTI